MGCGPIDWALGAELRVGGPLLRRLGMVLAPSSGVPARRVFRASLLGSRPVQDSDVRSSLEPGSISTGSLPSGAGDFRDHKVSLPSPSPGAQRSLCRSSGILRAAGGAGVIRANGL